MPTTTNTPQPPPLEPAQVHAVCQALRKHDWFYDMSDDPRYYRRGVEQGLEIDTMLNAIPVDLANALWEAYAPVNFPRPWRDPVGSRGHKSTSSDTKRE